MMVRTRDWILVLAALIGAMVILSFLQQEHLGILKVLGPPVQILAAIVTGTIALAAHKSLRVNHRMIQEMSRNRRATMQPVLVPGRAVAGEKKPRVTVTVAVPESLPAGTMTLELQNVGNGPAVRAQVSESVPGRIEDREPDQFYIGDGDRISVAFHLHSDPELPPASADRWELVITYGDVYGDTYTTRIILVPQREKDGEITARIRDVRATT